MVKMDIKVWGGGGVNREDVKLHRKSIKEIGGTERERGILKMMGRAWVSVTVLEDKSEVKNLRILVSNDNCYKHC